MPTASRAQVEAAILTLIRSVTFTLPIGGSSTWVTVDDRLRLWGDVDPTQQPSCFLVQHLEMDEYRNLGLLRRRLDYRLVCYCRTDDTSTRGIDLLDLMMQGFENAFRPDDPSRNNCTLGGLVYWARVEGRVIKDPGDIDNQAVLFCPLVVEMP